MDDAPFDPKISHDEDDALVASLLGELEARGFRLRLTISSRRGHDHSGEPEVEILKQRVDEARNVIFGRLIVWAWNLPQDDTFRLQRLERLVGDGATAYLAHHRDARWPDPE